MSNSVSKTPVINNIRQWLLRVQSWMVWFPLTAAGVAVVLVCVLALRTFGYGRMDLVVFALTICGLSIVGCSLVMVVISGLLLKPRLRQAMAELPNPALTAEAGYPNSSGFVLPAYSWLPLMNLDWQLVSPDRMRTSNRLDNDTGQLEEEITPELRCLSHSVTRRFTLRDVLGLCRFSWHDTRPAQWQILPQTGHLRSLPVLRSMDAEDGMPSASGLPQGDRMDIRRYAPGDSTRDILWRVYARNRHLNVRLPERSVFYAERTLAYLISGPEDEAAAGVARFAITRGALGSPWVFGADGSSHTASTAAAAMPLIAGSRFFSGRPRTARQAGNIDGLEDFLQQQGQQAGGSQQSACIVFAPATPGPWLERLQKTLTRYPGPFSVVLAADGLSAAGTQDSTPSVARKLMTHLGRLALEHKDIQSGVDTRTLTSVMADLSRRGAHVVLVDRQSGQSFDQRLKRV
ncbi:MAG: DUF58 domain-containing protein [Gammaproteobacteria bacterium]|nr:DUF58 domain-containing protein [Gammaproteobacteria bacterium]